MLLLACFFNRKHKKIWDMITVFLSNIQANTSTVIYNGSTLHGKQLLLDREATKVLSSTTNAFLAKISC